MDYREKVLELIKYGKLAGEKNFTPGYSGNLSARYGENVIITTSGSANGYLTEDDFVVIDYAGNVVSGKGKPSSEKFLHLEFYKKRPDINYVIHVHPVYLSAFASAGKDLTAPVMPENVFYFGAIPLAEYGLPGSMDLVDKTAEYFNKYDAVLMANHGVIIGSKTLRDAYMKLELAESYAQTIAVCEILGGPKHLTNEQVNEIIALKG
ncbi:MAG: class II aldolase/adducin family protein [Fusobacterium sp.]|nr:class II aldolase/adducin family protein [Fusobacterium sp.]